jgi:uncharacterized protein (TIGR03032 family)
MDQESTSPPLREVRYRHSVDLVRFLEHYGVCLLVSTYQAGKLAVVSAWQGQLRLQFLNFDQPMGIAVHPRRIAVGTRGQVWFLESTPQIAAQLPPAGSYDACYIARTCQVTGELHVHDMAYCGDELWVVNTLFSCLATLHGQYSFVPRWRPEWISALAAEDRCHLNGLALVEGRPRYVTLLGRSDTAGGWRPGKAEAGCLWDLSLGAPRLSGLCMPHSPRVHQEALWLLDSGHGRLARVVEGRSEYETVCALPGYTRGLALFGPYACVGLSRIRETSTFGGLPLAERREELKCGVWIVDCRSGQTAVYLEFEAGVEEIYDVQVIPGVRRPYLSGPSPAADGEGTLWVVPVDPA